MALSGMLGIIRQLEDFRDILAGIRRGRREQLVVGLGGSQKTAYLAALFEEWEGPLLVLTYNLYQAERMAEDLTTYLGPGRAAVYPPSEVLPHEEVLPNVELLGQRLGILSRLVRREHFLVLVPIRGLAEKLPPAAQFRDRLLTLKQGERLDLTRLTEQLAALGYTRVDMVEGRGQFALRGGILDLYPPGGVPVRVELFDDEIDSLRCFDLETQRSLSNQSVLHIEPALEFLLPAEEEAKLRGLVALAEAGKAQVERLKALDRKKEAQALEERLAAHQEKLAAGIAFPGMDLYKPFFYPLVTLLDYYWPLPLSPDPQQSRPAPAALVVLDEPGRTREVLINFEYEFADTHAQNLEKGKTLPVETQCLLFWDDLQKELEARPLLEFSLLDKRIPGMHPEKIHTLPAETPPLFHGKIDALGKELRRRRLEGYRTIIVLSTQDRATRLQQGLLEERIEGVVTEEIASPPPERTVTLVPGDLETGFRHPTARLLVLTDTEVFGREKKKHRVRTATPEGLALASFTELKPGDYVVHVNHGIGQYLGIETMEVGGIRKDYLTLKYAGDDRLYIPVDQISLLQKYIGAEGVPPKLYKLGGNEWNRVKSKVKESVQELAQGLLKLYAERQKIRGHSFPPDTVWQKEFEDAFPYEETPDQLRAIAEVKADMEKPRPMDRLLCGDVGYGKTEVAIRAAFKAVMDGKQVAVLVPTTILAQQHYNTFRERFRGYPVKIAVLSRFQTPKEQNATLKKLSEGEVDIIIGTHRLLQKDITFKDLGLVVVDEEQRFGVAQKELLKEMCKTVDVLTMTATPIPRTLHMSLVGVRDMSIIETPPEDRYPVRTYVIEYQEDVIREAILRELARQGQVYFVYNRIGAIDRMAAHLAQLVPEARIAVAHGQMPENELEQVMLDFLEGEYDLLLSTTIIETGLDIPNVNTLIVYDADHFGLSQLYQLRGRVGRTNRVAYAYFTYRQEKILTEDAEKRLAAIKEFTELGSGFKIAMRDLEIRGAGNLLGPEQHGHIGAVGFEMYCKLVNEAVKELKREEEGRPAVVEEEFPDPVIDLGLDAFINDEYIPDAKQKIAIYRRLTLLRDLEAVEDLGEELLDRYGDWPEPVANLLKITRLRVLAKKMGVASLISDQLHVTIRFQANARVAGEKLITLVQKKHGTVQLVAGQIPQLKVKRRYLSKDRLFRLLEEVLQEISSEAA